MHYFLMETLFSLICYFPHSFKVAQKYRRSCFFSIRTQDIKKTPVIILISKYSVEKYLYFPVKLSF